MKNRSTEKFLKNLREIIFPNYLTYTCLNDAYSDFIYRSAEAINLIAPAKRIRAKTNSKHSFDNHVMSVIQRGNKLYKKFKHSGLETVSYKTNKMHLQKFVLKKKKSYSEKELAKNWTKPKELKNDLKSLGLNSGKASKSKISLQKNGTIQFEALENANRFYFD